MRSESVVGLGLVAAVVTAAGCLSSSTPPAGGGGDAGSSSGSGSSSGGDSGGAASALVGTWTCDGTSTLAGQSPYTDPAQVDVIVANADGSLTDTWSGAGGSCAVRFTVSGATASVVSGQSCQVDQNGYAGGEITSGTFVVSGSTATITSTFAVAADGGATSTLTYAGTCTKS